MQVPLQRRDLPAERLGQREREGADFTVLERYRVAVVGPAPMPSMPRSSPGRRKPVTCSRPSSLVVAVLKQPLRIA